MEKKHKLVEMVVDVRMQEIKVYNFPYFIKIIHKLSLRHTQINQ